MKLKNKREDNLKFWIIWWKWKEKPNALNNLKKSKSKEWGPYLKKITNHNYRPYDDIENKLKYEKRAKRKKRIKVEILVYKRIYLKF